MTQEEALKLLAIMKAAYPNSYRDLSKQDAIGVANVWALQFADMPADIVHIALQKAISACKFPPSICEVKEKIRSLYWEARDALEWGEGFEPSKLTGRNRETMQRVYEITKPYGGNKLPEPDILQLLPYELYQPVLEELPGNQPDTS